VDPRLPRDLHLEHIHIAPRRLSIFDCIEFNDPVPVHRCCQRYSLPCYGPRLSWPPGLIAAICVAHGRGLERSEMLLLTGFLQMLPRLRSRQGRKLSSKRYGTARASTQESRERAGSGDWKNGRENLMKYLMRASRTPKHWIALMRFQNSANTALLLWAQKVPRR
jgi:hypothetical protein